MPLNTQKILDLKEKKGIKDKDFLNAIGRQGTSLKHILYRYGEQRNVSSETLEKIADVLGVSIDEFFDRNITVNGVVVAGSSVSGGITQENNTEHKHLKELMAEKDKRIELLEQLVQVLRSENCK